MKSGKGSVRNRWELNLQLGWYEREEAGHPHWRTEGGPRKVYISYF